MDDETRPPSCQSESARAAVLGRVRTALRDVPAAERPEEVPIARAYRTADPSSRESIIHLFLERVADYNAKVQRVDEAALPGAIAAACASRGVKTLVVPADIPGGWAPEGATLLRDPGLSIDQLESSDGVLTACSIAIAQTGTIVLDSGVGQGRRALTLLPDYHLCVVREDQIVALVPEAIAHMAKDAAAKGRPITFISGPSATSDIELNRVEGVHGPRTLEVLVVRS
jgi:L-lactate dehydrogenase complex protein LldG